MEDTFLMFDPLVLVDGPPCHKVAVQQLPECSYQSTGDIPKSCNKRDIRNRFLYLAPAAHLHTPNGGPDLALLQPRR
jgi:hypothetical protein